jgi:hypothetical protein
MQPTPIAENSGPSMPSFLVMTLSSRFVMQVTWQRPIFRTDGLHPNGLFGGYGQ